MHYLSITRRSFWALKVMNGGLEGLKVVKSGGIYIHLFRHFGCRVYRLGTMHSVIDRQTDRQTDETNGQGRQCSASD